MGNPFIYRTRMKLAGFFKDLFSKKEKAESSDIMKNGEANFARKIIRSSTGRIVIFDVGANVGGYTKMILDLLQEEKKTDFEIHLFEPQLSCFETLQNEFKNRQGILINNFGLSNENGEATIHLDFEGSSWGSIYDRKGLEMNVKNTIQLKKLSDYMQEQNLHTVDLLKIDTEGNEKRVMEGSGKYLDPSVIKGIQFEYGGCFMDAGITLKEVAQLLMERKYQVGRIQSEEIVYKDKLSKFVEDYTYSNYIAVANKL